MKNKKMLIVLIIVVIAVLVSVLILFNKKDKNIKIESVSSNEQVTENVLEEVNQKKDEKIDIIDVNSKTRPYAIVVNNTPVAVKVQTGLNKAYLVYEIPTEGNTSRLMALYKDIQEDIAIGTIRSSRHNFIDYALESDAIYVHYGWSHYAEDDQRKGIIDYFNGLFDSPFWRDNPEGLASEHTAYTSIAKIKKAIENDEYKKESDKTILFNYNSEDVDLSNFENNKEAKKITIPYGQSPNITTFEYDEENKMYNRMEDGEYCIDHKTKEKVNTKNIIVQKIDYEMCSDNYYWNLKTIGSGKGYFITNGYSVPITWKKDSRESKTKYFYENGNEIELSDGRTYVELQTNEMKLDIE